MTLTHLETCGCKWRGYTTCHPIVPESFVDENENNEDFMQTWAVCFIIKGTSHFFCKTSICGFHITNRWWLWWIFFIFPPILGVNDPIWRAVIFCKWVGSNHQLVIILCVVFCCNSKPEALGFHHHPFDHCCSGVHDSEFWAPLVCSFVTVFWLLGGFVFVMLVDA